MPALTLAPQLEERWTPPPSRLDARGRLEAIIAVQNELMAQAAPLPAVLALVATKTQRLTGADGAAVELVDGEDLVYRAATGAAASHLGARIPAKSSLSGLCVRQGEVLSCDDTELDSRVNRALCREIGVRSMVVVPIVFRGHTAGVLKVMASRPRGFDEEHVDTLRLMAGMIGAAIVRSEELARQERLREELNEAVAAREAAVIEREFAALELQRSNELLHHFFATAPFAISVVQREGEDLRYVAINPRAAQVLGRTPAELTGRLATRSGTPQQVISHVLRLCEQSDARGGTFTFEHAREQRVFSVSACTLGPGSPDGEQRYCFISQDVTEQQQLKARAELNDRLASVGTLAAGVAHEANNPLAYVIANLRAAHEMVQDCAAALAPDVTRELLETIAEAREGADRVRLIIRDLYSFVRSEEEPMSPIELGPVVKRALTLSKQALGTGITVNTELAPAHAVGSGARLGQVVINLLVNAAQAMPPGRSAAENKISVRTGALPDGRAFLEVADTGAGMTPEVQRRIFEPFYTTKPIGKGMGLGLSLCHGIVRAHGGELTVTSTPGQGSCFRLVLPAPAER